MERFSVRVGLCCLLLVTALGLFGQERPGRPRVYAIEGVKIVTAPGKVLEKGTIIIRDGLIEAVGADVKAPEDAQVLEAEEDWVVYPAFIDAATGVGIKTEEQNTPSSFADVIAAATRPREPAKGAQHQIERIHPQHAAVDMLQVDKKAVDKHRKMGFGAAHVLPKKGIMRGYSTIITLREDKANHLVLTPHFAQVMALETGFFFGSYPSSKMGVVAAVRQAMIDAQQLDTWRTRYKEDPKGLKRPPFESSLDPLVDVLNDKTPVLMISSSDLSHDRFAEIAGEFGVKSAMVRGTGKEWRYLDRVKANGFPVLLPLKFPKKPEIKSDEDIADISLQQMQDYLNAPRTPSMLAEAGVTFAFVTDGMENASNMLKNVKAAIDEGLSEDAALAALTTTPASLLGVDAVLGTVETGKIANIFVVKGDLFVDKPKFRYLFVDGIHEEFEAKASKGDPNAVVDPSGIWEVSVAVMGQNRTGTWTIKKSGDSYSGFTEDERGKEDINSITLEGNEMTVNLNSPMGGTFDVTLLIEGETFAGEAEFAGGQVVVKFTGKRTSKDPGQEAL